MWRNGGLAYCESIMKAIFSTNSWGVGRCNLDAFKQSVQRLPINPPPPLFPSRSEDRPPPPPRFDSEAGGSGAKGKKAARSAAPKNPPKSRQSKFVDPAVAQQNIDVQAAIRKLRVISL